MVLARHALRLMLATALAIAGLLISFVVAPVQGQGSDATSSHTVTVDHH